MGVRDLHSGGKTDNVKLVIQRFREHLALDKFKGVDVDGERVDWISVSDVQSWLDILEDANDKIEAE